MLFLSISSNTFSKLSFRIWVGFLTRNLPSENLKMYVQG